MISKSAASVSQQPQPKQRMHLVRPDSPRRTPIPAGGAVSGSLAAAEAASLVDPLEVPLSSHCSLCGNGIKGRSFTEKRMSGRNFVEQVWFYHEMCWKQLVRMRRWDQGRWQSSNNVAVDVRYSTSSLESLPVELSDCLGSSWTSNLAG